MEKFKLEIISPQKALLKKEVDMVVLPGKTGCIGIMKNHAPLLAALTKGNVRVKLDEDEENFEIEGGFVEVNENGVTVLVT